MASSSPSPPLEERAGERRPFTPISYQVHGKEAPYIICNAFASDYHLPMNPVPNARRLRRDQTKEEKQLWLALKAGRFAGFKFRRQHPFCDFFLDFYCPMARLALELDGFRHGTPTQFKHDAERTQLLDAEGIEVLRFWNHQWRSNREGILLEIWHALHRRTGCVEVSRKVQNHRYKPPKPEQLTEKSSAPPMWYPWKGAGPQRNG